MFRKISIIACALFPLSASATINLHIDAETLKTAPPSPQPMPVSGLVLLVADTLQNGFADVTPGSSLAYGGSFTLGGDDLVIGRWDLSNFSTPGSFSDGTGSLTLTDHPNWSQGDPFQLYWFPDRTLSDSTAPDGTRYGKYHDPTPSTAPAGTALDGSDPWFTPADGTPLTTLKFFTSDSPGGGSNLPSAGEASLTVVPEPSQYATFFGILCVGAGVFSRIRRRISSPDA